LAGAIVILNSIVNILSANYFMGSSIGNGHRIDEATEAIKYIEKLADAASTMKSIEARPPGAFAESAFCGKQSGMNIQYNHSHLCSSGPNSTFI
jgi:hypothetical protein